MTATIDDVKKFWNDPPCNVMHSKNQTGTKEYFDEVEKKNFLLNLTLNHSHISMNGMVKKF